MNNEIQIFNSSEFGTLSVLMINGRAYFPATECAAILGYAKPHNAIATHCRYSLKQGVPPIAKTLSADFTIPVFCKDWRTKDERINSKG